MAPEVTLKIEMKDVKIQLPIHVDSDIQITQPDFIEWFEFELGIRQSITKENKLLGINLTDCVVTIGDKIYSK